MEYLEHGDLEKHLNQPPPENEARGITSQILEGLSLMHENGFVHRNLKPRVSNPILSLLTHTGHH
jgi:serine/threonine protein kinase